MQISPVIALVVSCRSVKEASSIDVEVILHNLHCGIWLGGSTPEGNKVEPFGTTAAARFCTLMKCYQQADNITLLEVILYSKKISGGARAG